MVTYMNEQKIQTLEDVKVFLAGTLEVEFSIQDKDERYRWLAARAEAERSSTNAAESLEASLRRREQLAMDKIAQAEADALQAVRNTAVDVAVAATRKLLTDRLDDAAATGLIDQAIAELPQRLH